MRLLLFCVGIAVFLFPSVAAQNVGISYVSVEGDDRETTSGARVSLDYGAYYSGPGDDIEDVTIGFVLSEDDVYDSGVDDLLETEDIGIDADEGEDEGEQVSLPGGLAPGCYTLFVVADYYDTISEPNEADNARGQLIAIDQTLGECGVPQPDLIVRRSVLSRNPVVTSESFRVTTTMVNIGESSAFDADVSFVWSTTPDYDPFEDTYLDFSFDGTLFAGDSVRVQSDPLGGPAGTTPGTYYVHVVADYFSDVSESDEGNNVQTLRIRVEGDAQLPDLRFTEFDLPRRHYTPGEFYSGEFFSFTAINEGQATARGVRLTRYLSTDETRSEDDVAYDSYTVSDIAVGETGGFRKNSFTMDDVEPGEYYFLFVLSSSTDDLDPDDNVIAFPVTISGEPNQAPTSDTVVDGQRIQVRVGQRYTATYSFSDPNADDTVLMTIANKPFQFITDVTEGNPTTVEIDWTPAESQAGREYTVLFYAEDGSATTSTSVTYEVAPAQNGSVTLRLAEPTGDVTLDCSSQRVDVEAEMVNSGGSAARHQLWAVAEQTQGGSLFRVVKGPWTLTADAGASASRSFRQAIPGTDSDATYAYRLYLGDHSAGNPRDGDGAIDELSFLIRQRCGGPSNSAPVSDTVADGQTIRVVVGETYTATYTFSDPDAGDSVVASFSSPPAAFSVSSASGNPATVEIDWTPLESQAGSQFPVTFTASDGSASTEVTVTYAVESAPSGTLQLALTEPTGHLTLACTRQSVAIAADLTNGTASAADVDVWVVAEFDANGRTIRRLTQGPTSVALIAGQSAEAAFTQKVGRTSATRTGTFTVFAGDYAAGDPVEGDGAFGSGTFDVTQSCDGVAAKGGAGAMMEDEPFALAVSPEATTLGLAGVSDQSLAAGATDRPVEIAPNPATRRVRFQFALAEPADGRLVVFDALGREVAAVAEGALNGGEHTFTLDLADLPAGLYLWRLATDAGRAETGRFTVVR